MQLFFSAGLEYELGFERQLETIIDRLKRRHLHRNAVSDRKSTAEKVEFLKETD